MRTADASAFLNAETLSYIEQKRAVIREFAMHHERQIFPDLPTRAMFYREAPALLAQMCDMMAGNVDLIHKHHLHEHEYAREITDASVECYKEARTLQIKLEARICAEKRGAA
jgi:hypothetical protein